MNRLSTKGRKALKTLHDEGQRIIVALPLPWQRIEADGPRGKAERPHRSEDATIGKIVGQSRLWLDSPTYL